MSASKGYALEIAEKLAGFGYKLVPIPSGEKYPRGFGRWQDQATDHPATIKRWFALTNHGVGWAMGLQPNGKFLAAIDVDGEEGWESLFELIKTHGGNKPGVFMDTVCQNTGGGGGHFVFEFDVPIHNSAKQIAPHIDIRGEGGQIVVGPTIHPNGNPYIWTNLPDGQDRPLKAPQWLVDLILSEPEPVAELPKVAVPTRSSGDDSPADWVRDNVGIDELLHDNGWTYMETKGDDTYWCRPGKNPRDGHSAILHGAAPLVVWSTEVPWRTGSDNRDGSMSFSPMQVYAEIHFGGDISEASKVIRREFMPRTDDFDPLASVPVASAATGTDVVTTSLAPLNLPDEFWEARPWLSHVRQAAESRLVSPDALLVSVLARFAALLPATLQIPGIVGGNATFDFIGCVVASSSGGKTVANSVAAEILPNVRTDVMMDASVGSGEGLVAAFMDRERDDKGKKIGDPSWKFGKIKAIHFNVDEGTGLMEQQSRSGTTIVQTLCSAWSGAGLGQLNASVETRRFVPAKKRRISAVLNIQTGFGHKLLAEDMKHVGLPQRILFSWAHAPLAEVQPSWPGRLEVPIPPGVGGVKTVSFDQEIIAEVVATRRSVLAGTVVLGELDGHANLVRLKVASMIALLDAREHVAVSDWELAGEMMSVSSAVRSRLLEVKREADEKAVVTQGTRQATREMAAEDAKERQKIARMADRIEELAAEQEWTWSKLRKKITSGESRHRFEAAVYMAQARGAVEIVDIEGTGEAGRLIRRP